ncbi:hypothetical protein B0H14DRAFT_3424727 [Mycena olivaceomarginata]|nr:hypothetical protein B0H14DRAFT_3424727 [Mycena olivaceomarginata]
MTLVRTSTEIFAGAGVYTIAELWHMAGLSPNLTEAEVFDSGSRTGSHWAIMTLVKRFLVDYVICVREEHRLLYSDRLHVYGKDRAYVTSRFSELLTEFKETCNSHSTDDLWIRGFSPADGPFDVFEPDLVRHALWAELHSCAGLPAGCLRNDDVLSDFFATTPIPANMSATWLNPFAYTYLFNDGGRAALRASHPRTLLYRASATDIWSVIPIHFYSTLPLSRFFLALAPAPASDSLPTPPRYAYASLCLRRRPESPSYPPSFESVNHRLPVTAETINRLLKGQSRAKHKGNTAVHPDDGIEHDATTAPATTIPMYRWVSTSRTTAAASISFSIPESFLPDTDGEPVTPPRFSAVIPSRCAVEGCQERRKALSALIVRNSRPPTMLALLSTVQVCLHQV